MEVEGYSEMYIIIYQTKRHNILIFNLCLIWKLYETRKYILWTKCEVFFNVKSCGTYSHHSALKG
jgi:hypothetical protein